MSNATLLDISCTDSNARVASALCILGYFSFFFCSLLIFFRNQLFCKILSGIPSECPTVWILIRHDILSGLIWTQTVCKGYQQTELSRQRLNPLFKNGIYQVGQSQLSLDGPLYILRGHRLEFQNLMVFST